MFVDFQVTFIMLSFCYAQRLSYLHRTIFPSTCIFATFTKFDGCTITMLEKLLRSGSFGTIVGHLVCCQVIFPTSLGGLSLPSMVRRTALPSLRCWALIPFALISHFQQNDHPTLFDVVAHVETNTYPFHVALQNTHVMLPKVIQSHVLLFKSLVM
jgi:hypothetical protein